jgi:hypothetical protein
MESMTIAQRLKELRARLDGMAQAHTPAPPAPQKAQAQAVRTPALKSAEERKRAAFSRMNRLHATLPLMDSDGLRLNAAIEILALDREVQRCWRELDGKGTASPADDEEEEEDGPFDPAAYTRDELVNMRNSARAYVSKAKKKHVPPEALQERLSMIEEIDRFLKQ